MSLSRGTTVFSRRLRSLLSSQSKAMYGSDPKDGGGSGGAGAIREAGGAFGKREAAQEEQYFRKLQAEQLGKLKSHLDDEIKHHQEEIKRHQESIDKLKKRSKEMEKQK